MSTVKNWKIKDANGNTITVVAKTQAAAKHQFKQILRGAEVVEIKCLGDARQKKISLPYDDSVEFKPVSQAQVSKLTQGRNDLCRCGSGRKYKKCCINKPE